jgi:hypothetical protein
MGPAVALIEPGDADAAARTLIRLADDHDARGQMVSLGIEYAGEHTMEAEVDRVAAFLAPSPREALDTVRV